MCIRDSDNARVAADVGVRTNKRNVPRAVQKAVRIERQLALEKVVGRVAVEERGGAHQNQPLVFVCDVNEGVGRMDRLFLVLRRLDASGIGGERRRGSNSCCVHRFHIELLADGRYWGRGDSLGKALVVDEGNVKHAESPAAAGGIEKLAASLG